MNINKTLNVLQSTFGAFITCLATFVIINIATLQTMTIQEQLNMLWILVCLSLLIYGIFQILQGLFGLVDYNINESKKEIGYIEGYN